MKSSGKLYICPTPIGNLEDITLRVLRILKQVNLIAAEDTRTTKKLLNKYEIRTPLTSYHEHNKVPKSKSLLEKLEKGKEIALVSEAGTPGLSDPGYRLIRVCLSSNIDVEVLPGPSANITALVSSGLPTDSFIFIGFLPKKKSRRLQLLNQLATESRTIIFYESPHRVRGFLSELQDTFGQRRIALARELTKKFEEVIRGNISEVIKRIEDQKLRGEMVIVVDGKKRQKAKDVSVANLQKEIKQQLLKGETKKEAIKKVALKHELPKRVVYEAGKNIKIKS